MLRVTNNENTGARNIVKYRKLINNKIIRKLTKIVKLPWFHLETISAHILRIFDRIYLFRLNCELTVQFICSELCVSNM